MPDAALYETLAKKWDSWRAEFNRMFLRFAHPDTPMITLRPSDLAYTTLLGRLATTRRALSELQIEIKHSEQQHAECRAMLVAALMNQDPEYGAAKNDAARRAVMDLRLDADQYPIGNPMSGSALRTGYRSTKTRLATLREEEARLSTELTIIRDERRMFEALVDYRADSDVRYENEAKSKGASTD